MSENHNNGIVIKSTIASEIAGTQLSRHCVATIIAKDTGRLTNASEFIVYLRKIIKKQNIRCVGEIVNEFDNHSYTAVLALAESHISVHTWPERLSVQLDVFLCNYMHDNTLKCESIFESIIDYFDPSEVERIYLDRI